MATLETQQLDQIISSRRAMLMLGGTALAGIALAGTASAQATAPSDADILNFALNLEYLEANYYYAAAFGVTIDKATSAMNGTGPLSINGGASSGGVVASVKASPKVPFTTVAVNSYAIETAIEEGKHVAFLQSALGSAAVAQPAIDLTGGTGYGSTAAWNTLAAAATIGPMFDPFMSDANFLVGAYVFEDVGVTAYHGAAPGISTAGIAKGYLTAAAGILAVEAYHAGLVRTSLTQLDPSGSLGLIGYATKISALRAKLSLAALPTDADPGDNPPTTETVTLGAASGQVAQVIANADKNALAYSRTTTQVLNIVTGGASTASPYKGVFFPSGMNGNIK
jgi:hypothetical protein